jgi:hypothetical protein
VVLLDDGEDVLLLEEGEEALLLDAGEEALLLDAGEADDPLLGSLEAWPDDWDDDAPPPCTPSAASVCWSSCPDAVRLFCCWNCLSAAWVFGPIWPSIGPTSRPLDCSACWAWRTSWLPCEELSLEEAVCDALLEEVCEVLLSFARTAALESAKAATTKGASFME